MPQNLATAYSTGDLIEGRFRVLELLGEGGMGAVYKVKDTIRGGDPLALKVLSKVSPGRLARFFQEAQTLRQLKNPLIVSYHGFHDSADSSPVLVTEYLAGGSLEGLFDVASTQSPPLQEGGPEDVILPSGLPRALVLELVRQCAEALMGVHSASIAHRDLKPANLLLKEPPLELLKKRTGTLKLADFGIAARNPDEEPHLTQLGSLIGTLDYAAPEYLELLIEYHRAALDGKEPRWSRSLDAEMQGDVFALGLILYRAWFGKSFWERTSLKRLSDEPDPRLPNARRALDAALTGFHSDAQTICQQDPIWPVMAGLLERDPARRHTAERACVELSELQRKQHLNVGARWLETAKSRSSVAELKSVTQSSAGDSPSGLTTASPSRERAAEVAAAPKTSRPGPGRTVLLAGVALTGMLLATVLLWKFLLDPGAVLVAFLSSDEDPTPRPPFKDGWVATREEREAGMRATAADNRAGSSTPGVETSAVPEKQVGKGDGKGDDKEAPRGSDTPSAMGSSTDPAEARGPREMPSGRADSTDVSPPSQGAGSTGKRGEVPCLVAAVTFGPAGIAFAKIPGGTLPQGKEGRPPARSTVVKAYEMALTEITLEQYHTVLKEDLAKGTDGKLPKTRVSWTQAQAFAKALDTLDPSYRYQLPTEAQWELAARGTDGRRFPWGAGAPTRENRLANFAGMFEADETHSRIRPVGSFCGGMSPWKVLDLAGNVEEWTADCYDKTWPGQADPSMPREKCEFPEKVLRGGHYKTEAVTRLESSARRFARAEATEPTIGFRVVRVKRQEGPN